MRTQRTNRLGSPAALSALALTVMLGGCGGESAPAHAKTSALYDATSPARALGWLGGRVHPTLQSVEVPVDGSPTSTKQVGGLVVTELLPAGALAAAGITDGDVLVRVAEDWLPNREDPGMDFLRAVEAQVSSGAAAVELGLLRAGKIETVAVAHDQVPIEVGLPGPSERFTILTKRGLDWLVAHQGADGAFAGADDAAASVAASSLAGLAFLGGGAAGADSPYASPLDKCRAHVEAAVDDAASPLDAWGAALATMFLAELAGPLDMKIHSVASGAEIAGAGGAGTFTMGGLSNSGGLPEGVVVYGSDGGDIPAELEELLSSLNLGADSDVQISFMGAVPAGMEGATPGSFTPMPEGKPATGPLWTMEQLARLAETDPTERLAPVGRAVARLLALQTDAGGWDPEGAARAYSDATLATNQALLALGMAERVGVPVETDALRRALAFVRARTNDGHVFFVDDPGFDRRREAGRANGAALALTALHCAAKDEFLGELLAYGEQHAATIADASAAGPLHVLHTALLRRHQGLGPWAVFFEEFRHPIASLQDPDGSFAPWAGASDSKLAIDALCTSPAVRTALWSLVTALQADRLPVLLATARNPLQTEMTSEAVRHESPLASLPAGAVMMGGAEFIDASGVDLQELLRGATQGKKDEGD